MHRPTTISLLSHKITTVQQKTNRQNKHDKLSHQSITQTITTNNPYNLSIKNTLRQTQQAITKKCNVF